MAHSAPRSRRAAKGFVGSVRAAERSPDNRADVRTLLRRRPRLLRRSAAASARDGLPLTPLETIAADWIDAHPEYDADLADAEARARRDLPGREPAARTRSCTCRCTCRSASRSRSTSRAGIRQAFELLAARLGSAHAAQHEVMECLGTMLWEAQRSGRPPDGARYVDCVRRRATR